MLFMVLLHDNTPRIKQITTTYSNNLYNSKPAVLGHCSCYHQRMNKVASFPGFSLEWGESLGTRPWIRSEKPFLAWDSSPHLPVTLSQPVWRSQDDQVTWAQHGHIQCTHNTHLLGELGHTPAIKFFWHSEIASEAIFGHKYHSFKSYLYTRFMSTWKQSHMLTTGLWPQLSTLFMWAQAQVCLGVATPLITATEVW